MAKSGKYPQNIWLKNGTVEITHPQNVAESFNSYFIHKVDQLVGTDRYTKNDQNSQVFVKNSHSSMFFFLVSEDEVVKVVSN
jgi:hypothetical protein